jgi:immunoglobulin-like protein involved in spore germination/sporulation and spore germination protein
VNDDRLSAAFHDAVEDVEPTDRLAAIRQQTRARRSRRWYAVGGAVLATAAVVTAVALAARPTPDPGPGPSKQPTATDSAPEGSTALAAYYLGATPQGPRLFREFHQTSSGDPLASVLRGLTSASLDPDYHTAWPPGAFAGGWIDYEGGVATVLLRDTSLHDRPAGMTAAEARLAIQQVVYTVQAFAQQRIPVQFQVAGQPVDQVYGVPASEPLDRAPELDVLALVSISNPTEARTVEGSFTADGVASSFEGTVHWELRDADGDAVRTGVAQGSMEDQLTPWATGPIDVSDLPPGSYVFQASTDDPSEGEGGGPTVDTRTVVIR